MLDAAATGLTYRQNAKVALAATGTDPTRGLSEPDARARLRRYGPNSLAAGKSRPAWRRFLAQFQDPLVILLLMAPAVSVTAWAVERESAVPYGAIVIVSVVLLNAVLLVAVIHVSFLQPAFSTVSLRGADWLRCLVYASAVLWVREATKLAARLGRRARRT